MNANQPMDGGKNSVPVLEPIGLNEEVVSGGNSTARTEDLIVRLVSPTGDDISYSVGLAPDATVTGERTFLPSGVVESIKLSKGNIINVDGGTLDIKIQR